MLVGADSGLWHGVGYGFSATANATAGRGMNFTALNGNLQIAELTSVAIDPQTLNTYYTTQYDTGQASTASSSLTWSSGSTTGPAVQFNGFTFLANAPT